MFAACPGCPYGSVRKAGLTLQLPFLDRLFSVLGPHTPGIVFSGGEPTIVPHFPQALALAREKGFKEIAVISNGANIHLPRIQDALLEHATSIRISMYEWQERDSEHFVTTLKKLEGLRKRIETEGSRLELGASMLTRTEWNERYVPVGLRALIPESIGCTFIPIASIGTRNVRYRPIRRVSWTAIEKLRETAPADANIQVPFARYDKKAVCTSRNCMGPIS